MADRPTFSVRSLFWLTLSIAAFFAGRASVRLPIQDPVFVSLGEVDVFSPEHDEQVQIEVVLQVGDRFAKKVRSNRDRLREAVIIQTKRSDSRSVGPIDRSRLRQDLMQICTAIVGNNIIEDVLFAEFAF